MMKSSFEMGLLHRLTKTFTAMLALNVCMTAAQVELAHHSNSYSIDPQTFTVLRANAEISGDNALKETWKWLENLSSKPACTQIASSKLAADCQVLDDPSEFGKMYPGQILEDVQNEYALKLAICEIVGTQNGYPKAPPKCHVFLPSTKACAKRSWWGQAEAPTGDLCYPESSKADLASCLNTIQSSPQTWTSYSNARSRSAQICQLSRVHIDMQRYIDLHKRLTRSVSNIYDAVQDLPPQLRAMYDQIKVFSDDAQRFFNQTQEVTDEYKAFAEDALKSNRNQQEEVNQYFQKVKDFSNAVRTNIQNNYEADRARFNEMMMQTQDAAAVRAIAFVDNYAATTFAALNARFDANAEEVQEKHTMTIMALQKQYETLPATVGLIVDNLDNALSKSDRVMNRVAYLGNRLETSIGHAEKLASYAQTAREFVGNFDTFAFFTYFTVSSVVFALWLLSMCVSRIPFIGKAVHKLTTLAFATALLGISSHHFSQSFDVPTKLDRFMEALSNVELPEQALYWIKITACVLLFACTCLVLSKHFTSNLGRLAAMLPFLNGLSRVPASTQLQSISMTPPHYPVLAAQTPSLAQVARAAYVGKPILSRETEENKDDSDDEDLRERVGNFRRGTTVF